MTFGYIANPPRAQSLTLLLQANNTPMTDTRVTKPCLVAQNPQESSIGHYGVYTALYIPPLPPAVSSPWCLPVWSCGALASLLSLIYLYKLNLATVKTRTVTLVTRGNPRPDFCHPRAKVGIILFQVCMYVFQGSEGLPQLPEAAKYSYLDPAWAVLAPFLLAGRSLFPLTLSCLWLGCDLACKEPRLSSGLPLATEALAGCRPKPSQACARQLQPFLWELHI